MASSQNERNSEPCAARRAISRKHPQRPRLWPLWVVLFGLLALNGCAQRYVIKLNNGTQIGAIGKPKLTDGVYVYKDASGRESRIASGRVTEIAPASMVRDRKTMFNPAPAN